MFTYSDNYAIIFYVRDLFKIFLTGLVVFLIPQVNAEDYKVLVIPDNIVTETVAQDSFIYDASAEFFADEIVNLLNTTDYISAPTVSETRSNIKKSPTGTLATKNLTSRFKTTYNVDYVTLKKLSRTCDARYALLITSFIDSQNYILRRTVWDVLNIPGATVVDPAYKISTYAVLIDTENNIKLWSDTFYKTISVCENRIITRGTSPQAEQLQKIKDYSRYLCPQIAQSVQEKVLPAEILAKESKQIEYGIGNIDNVFTKKSRHIGKEASKIYERRKDDVCEIIDDTKVFVGDTVDKTVEIVKKANENIKTRNLEKKQVKLQEKLEVEAKPYYQEPEIKKEKESFFKNISFKKNKKETPTIAPETEINYIQVNEEKPVKIEANLNYYDTDEINTIDIKRTRKNRLIESDKEDKPTLRDYYQ